MDKIAERLDSDGVKPRSGRKWHTTTVYRILKVAGPFRGELRGPSELVWVAKTLALLLRSSCISLV